MTDPLAADQLHRYHEFRCRAIGERLFETRDPSLWLDDLLTVAGFERGEDFTEASAWHQADGELIITIDGTSKLLGFVLVLLNQHAEQSPGDRTPVDEARRWAATMDGAGHRPKST